MSILEEMFDDERQNLNERPYSRTTSAIDSAKGKVKGMFGSGQVEQGAREVGDEANRLWADFKRYIGRKYGSHPQSVSYQDVAAFFKGNNLDVSLLGTNQNRGFNTKDVGQALLQAARKMADSYAQQEQQQPQQAPAQNSPEPSSEEPAQPEPAPAQSGGLSTTLSTLSAEQRAKLLKLIS